MKKKLYYLTNRPETQFVYTFLTGRNSGAPEKKLASLLFTVYVVMILSMQLNSFFFSIVNVNTSSVVKNIFILYLDSVFKLVNENGFTIRVRIL